MRRSRGEFECRPLRSTMKALVRVHKEARETVLGTVRTANAAVLGNTPWSERKGSRYTAAGQGARDRYRTLHRPPCLKATGYGATPNEPRHP